MSEWWQPCGSKEPRRSFASPMPMCPLSVCNSYTRTSSSVDARTADSRPTSIDGPNLPRCLCRQTYCSNTRFLIRMCTRLGFPLYFCRRHQLEKQCEHEMRKGEQSNAMQSNTKREAKGNEWELLLITRLLPLCAALLVSKLQCDNGHVETSGMNSSVSSCFDTFSYIFAGESRCG